MTMVVRVTTHRRKKKELGKKKQSAAYRLWRPLFRSEAQFVAWMRRLQKEKLKDDEDKDEDEA